MQLVCREIFGLISILVLGMLDEVQKPWFYTEESYNRILFFKHAQCVYLFVLGRNSMFNRKYFRIVDLHR